MKSLQPINDNVAIQLAAEDEEKTPGGIYIPETAKEKPQIGEVMALSPDAESQLAVGDKVLFRKYSGTETNLDGKDYIIVSIGDILAKVVDVDAIPE